MENIQLKNAVTITYFGYNLISLILLSGYVISYSGTTKYDIRDFIMPLLSGALAGSFLVIPVHELIHGLSYKLIGAPKIIFGADLRQMIFYVASDKFILGRKGFYLVALSPFIMINIITIIILFNFSVPWIAGIMCFLFFHNIMCVGDFAMVSFFAANSDKELFTYDDHKERTSYIFERKIAASDLS